MSMDDQHGSVSPLERYTPGAAFRVRRNIAKDTILNALPPSRKREGTYKISHALPVTAQAVIDAVKAAASNPARVFVLSVSHDDFMSTCGGVQNCIGDEQVALAEAGVPYLSICPNVPLLALSQQTDVTTFEVLVAVDGQRVGMLYLSDLINVVRTMSGEGFRGQAVVHHMLGYAPEHLVHLVSECSLGRPYLWIHDAFTICPSIHLLRNEMTFCGAPKATSMACHVCNSGAERVTHEQRIAALFSALHPIVVAPSRTMADFWKRATHYPHAHVLVEPPATLQFTKDLDAIGDGPIRIAFLGVPAIHKGWHVFESLARWYANDSRYAFVHVGFSDGVIPGTQFQHVNVTREDRAAMIDALVSLDVHVTINWSLCFESFSFTTHESFAAGAYVIARAGAGHVATLLRSDYADRGLELDSEVQLQALLAGDGLVERVRQARRSRGVMTPGSGVSARIIEELSHA